MITETTKLALLTGDTFMVRDRLHGAGWRWDDDRRAYTLTVDDDRTPEGVVAQVRAIGGVRNRPRKLTVTFA